ncbi:MAG: S8 family peptidase [Candidatus Thermoplasmatota archaeon]|nr:S8 family peptidase [Candidatus Thermoplasmatota archaeon]
MSKIWTIMLVGLLLCFLPAGAEEEPVRYEQSLPQNRVIVGYEPGVRLPEVRGAYKVFEDEMLGFSVFEAAYPEDIAGQFYGMSGVRYVEPDYVATAFFTPNDPLFSQQYGPQSIRAPQAWDVQAGSEGVMVAVVDTGVDYTHEDLYGRVIPGYDYVNNDTDPMDDQGHGTHCAGIIGATLNNGVGIAGIAQVSIMAVKALDSQGSGYYSWISSGIRYAVDNGANVISMSLGGPSDSQVMRDACDYAWNNGVLVVAAAGNDYGGAVSYPAKYDSVMAVSAIDSNDKLAYYSNVGPEIEVCAPGSSVLSTYPGNQYVSMSGTSMACPHVAGVAGLVFSQSPYLSNVDVRNMLCDTAIDLGSYGWDQSFGYGKVNAEGAVLAA